MTVHEYLKVIFQWNAEQDIMRKTSTVTWQLLLEAGEYGRIDAIGGSPWEVKIDGQTFSGDTNITIAVNSTIVLAEGTVELNHRWWDGTRNFEYAFRQRLGITYSGVYTDYASGYGVGELDTFNSEPFCYRSYMIGVAAGRCLKGRYEPTHIIGYSYNGVFLPELPEWDTDALPNAMMLIVPGTRTYRLLLSNGFAVENLYGEEYVAYKDDYVCYTYDYNGDMEWRSTSDEIYSNRYDIDNVFWSNTVIAYSNGSPYISASAPIPIYG